MPNDPKKNSKIGSQRFFFFYRRLNKFIKIRIRKSIYEISLHKCKYHLHKFSTVNVYKTFSVYPIIMKLGV